MKTKNKEFDCVDMMHRGALRIHETLRGKTQEECLAYWRQKHVELMKELDNSRTAKHAVK